MDVIDDPDLGCHDFPPVIAQSLIAFSTDAAEMAFDDGRPLCELNDDQRLELRGLLNYVAHMGFAIALYRYADELNRVPELSRWMAGRKTAGDKGRATQSKAKLERTARARAMLAKGDDVPAIAAALNCTPSTVYRLLSPANGKPAKRSKRARKR